MSNDKTDKSVDWVSVEDVVFAADRGLAPLGPEVAGFVVLEAALRLRDLGGGMTTAVGLAIGTGGDVALTAPPTRADEVASTSALRLVLRKLLDVATASTPALRQYARKGASSLSGLCRELEGALIPLNRAASRRAVARLAKATLDAIVAGKLEGAELASDARNEQPSPAAPPVVARVEARPRGSSRQESPLQRTKSAEASATRRLLSEARAAFDAAVEASASASRYEDDASRGRELRGFVVQALDGTPPPLPDSSLDDEPHGFGRDESRACPDDFTPYAGPASWMRPEGDVPRALDDIGELASKLEAMMGVDGHGTFDVVTSFPPLVASVSGGAATSANGAGDAGCGALLALGPSTGNDAVDALLKRFRVSQVRDDRALSRDLKAMIGIDATRQPPAVALRAPLSVAAVSRPSSQPASAPASASTDDSPSAPASTPSIITAPVTKDAMPSSPPSPMQASRPSARHWPSRFAAGVACVAAISGGVATAGWARAHGFHLHMPPALRGPNVAEAHAASPADPIEPAPSPPVLPKVSVPVTCRATLTLDGVPLGAEVARKIGVSPTTLTIPTHTPLDVVAVAIGGGSAARRRIDASTPWLAETTTPHLDLTLPLDTLAAGDVTERWPSPNAFAASTSGSTLSAPSTTRGLLSIATTPAGADLWLVADPHVIDDLPCGAAIDLHVGAVGSSAATPTPGRTVRVEWSAFSGSPPRATQRL